MTRWKSVHGASYRGVYDLADLDRSLFIVTPGQSGNPLSRHARDFLTRWRDGAMVLLWHVDAGRRSPEPCGWSHEQRGVQTVRDEDFIAGVHDAALLRLADRLSC